jgi:hypothetical protein
MSNVYLLTDKEQKKIPAAIITICLLTCQLIALTTQSKRNIHEKQQNKKNNVTEQDTIHTNLRAPALNKNSNTLPMLCLTTLKQVVAYC